MNSARALALLLLGAYAGFLLAQVMERERERELERLRELDQLREFYRQLRVDVGDLMNAVPVPASPPERSS